MVLYLMLVFAGIIFWCWIIYRLVTTKKKNKDTKEATEKTVETVKEVAEEKQEKSIFADLFASEPIEDEEDDIFAALFGDDTEEEQKGKDEEFNIFAFFEEQDAMDKKISIIEKMEVFGDKVIEITLEDLALYNRNMFQRG